MTQKYKVFIKNKPLYLTNSEEFYKGFTGEKTRFLNKKSLSNLILLLESQKNCQSAVIFHWDLDELLYQFRKLYKFVQAAGGIVQKENGECLIIKRKGKWDIPKGKLDDYETPEEAAIREIEEECGISGLHLGEFLTHTYHTYEMKGQQHLKKTWWYFVKSDFEGELIPQTEEDITEVVWVPTERINEIRSNTYTSIHTVLDAFQEKLA